MSEFIFFIIYPGGDKTKIGISYESHACDYQINDYALASRQRWYEAEPAIQYCKELAKKHGLTYIPCSFDNDSNDYLD